MKGLPPQSMLTDALSTQIPGIHWPAVASTRDSAVLALLFKMESTQWLSAKTPRGSR